MNSPQVPDARFLEDKNLKKPSFVEKLLSLPRYNIILP